jgi:hypothetical protein
MPWKEGLENWHPLPHAATWTNSMGYRIIAIEMPAEPVSQIVTFLRQFAAFAKFQGLDVFVQKPKEYPGIWDLTIEGNSSYLDEFTPEIIRMAAVIAAVIAADIDPDSEDLKGTVTAIASQLSEQVVAWRDVPAITPARRGRELAQRLSGESSITQLKDELRIHETRIRRQLTRYRNVSGPTAWRQRHKLSLLLRVDCLALVGVARRLRRIASDLHRRLPSNHLYKAISRFDQKTSGLIALRDIAEHIDEYSIGHGKRDDTDTEPGEVFSVIIQNRDITITARGQALSILATHKACLSLINCLASVSDYRAFIHLIPVIVDFDFMTHNGQHFELVARGNETAEQSKERAILTEHTRRIQSKLRLPDKRCPECNEWL